MVDTTVQVFYTPPDFLPACSMDTEKEMLKSPAITVCLSISHFSSISFCFM